VRAPATTARESPSVAIEADHLRRHRAAIAPAGLDLDRVQQEIAHRERVAARVEDHGAAEAAAAEPHRRRGVLRVVHAEPDDGRLDAADERRKRGDLTGIEAAVRRRGRRAGGDGRDDQQARQDHGQNSRHGNFSS
jgi:hypothetical protein